MKAQAVKTEENNSHAAANAFSQKQHSENTASQFIDNRPEANSLKKLQSAADNRPPEHRLSQLQSKIDSSPRVAAQSTLQAKIDHSPRILAQRQQTEHMSGGDNQRQVIPEEESSQKKTHAPMQRQEMGDEKPLSGKHKSSESIEKKEVKPDSAAKKGSAASAKTKPQLTVVPSATAVKQPSIQPETKPKATLPEKSRKIPTKDKLSSSGADSKTKTNSPKAAAPIATAPTLSTGKHQPASTPVASTQTTEVNPQAKQTLAPELIHTSQQGSVTESDSIFSPTATPMPTSTKSAPTAITVGATEVASEQSAKTATPSKGAGIAAEAVPASETEAAKPATAVTAAPAKPESAKPGGAQEKGKGTEATADGGASVTPEGGVGTTGAVDHTVKLRMPEPPNKPSPATAKRIKGVQARAGGMASAHAALPSGASQVGEARQAVTEPDAEALAKAQAELINQVQAAPSPEIVKLCERIQEVIRNKRPPDQDALMEAKPEGEALNAGNQLNATVEGEAQKVQENYGAVNNPPTVATPAKGQDLPPQPQAAGTPPVNAQAATPDAVPPENVSLDADAADSKKKMQDAGMDKSSAKPVQSGPIAEARDAQGELDQVAKEDPAKVLAGQKEALSKAEGDMASLQAQALAALTNSRATTAQGASTQQEGMVGSEAAMRTKAGAEAKKAFADANTQVTALLKPLAFNAMAEWESAKEVLVTQFKNDLAIVQKRIDERHAGVEGFVVGLWDAVTGLPSWAEEAYTKAENNFGNGVIDKLTAISTKVNSVIAACDLIIKNARERIAKIFADLPESLQGWAQQEQARFDGQLDQLHNQVISTRDNFNKDLVSRSSQAVDEVRGQIAELRAKAGGLVGRIANAINRFLEDPVKFIIEGLLELVGIQPAAFWAVIAKIKQVAKDIADDATKFANNLFKGLGQGFSQFFDNIGTHLIKGFISWLTGGLGDVGVQIPKDFSLKSIITFFLQLMGITWPRIRKVLAKHVGEKNVALLEKVYSLVSFLMEKGPEGIYEMIQEKLDPQSIVDQVVQLAVDFLISAIIKQAAVRIIALFNPVGAIVQALEAIYRVLKWLFQNAARLFTFIETVVNGIADIVAGNIGGFASAVEKSLGILIAPVIAFIADYLSLGDLPSKIAEKIKSFQEWIMGLIEKALVWIIEKGKALLAAVGLGGKDKDKDKKDGKFDGQIGKTVTWVAEKHSHKLWIEEAGTGVAVRMASTEIDVSKKLDEYNEKAEEFPEEQRKNILAKVATARSLLSEVEKEADEVKKGAAQTEKPADLAAKDDAVESTEQQLASAIHDIMVLLGIVPEPVAGLHVVKRPAPFETVAGESHHVPAKGLGSGIAQFLRGAVSSLRAGEWQGDSAAEAVASAFESRADANQTAAAPPAEYLSAILLCPEAHTEEGGVHTIDGSGPVLASLATNPKTSKIVLVKRRTTTRIAGVTSYLAVNPQIASWRLFLADVRRALDDPGFENKPDVAPGDRTAVELILDEAQKECMDAEESSQEFLQDKVVKRTNDVLYKGVGDAYLSGKATVGNAMTRANDGTPEGRKAALSSLDGHFGSSWAQFRRPIMVDWPAGGE